MRSSISFSLALTLAAVLVCSPAARAHHSTAEFDYTMTLVISGEVKEVQWTNPHSYLQVLVPAPQGSGLDQWGVEIGAPNINVRMGWRKDSVKPGDKLTLTIAPARDGRKFGTLRFLTFTDGRRLEGVANTIHNNPSFN